MSSMRSNWNVLPRERRVARMASQKHGLGGHPFKLEPSVCSGNDVKAKIKGASLIGRSYSTVTTRSRRATVRSLKRRAKTASALVRDAGFDPGMIGGLPQSHQARSYKKPPPGKCGSGLGGCSESAVKNSSLAQDRHAVAGQRDANRATIAAAFDAKPRSGVE